MDGRLRPPSPWASPLDSADFLAARSLGLEPMDQVIATGVYLPLWGGPGVSGEVQSTSELVRLGWRNTVERMKSAAREKGADGIVGVKIVRRRLPETLATEFFGYGTPVRGMRGPELWTTFEKPSGVKILRDHGYEPLSVVFGYCAWFQSTWNFKPNWDTGRLWASQEIPQASGAMRGAKERALGAIDEAARAAGAHGVVGMVVRSEFLTMHSEEAKAVVIGDGLVADFEAHGTAVRAVYGGGEAATGFVVPLHERR